MRNSNFMKNRDIKNRLEGRSEMRDKMMDAKYDPSQEPENPISSSKTFIPHSDLFYDKANRIAMKEAV